MADRETRAGRHAPTARLLELVLKTATAIVARRTWRPTVSRRLAIANLTSDQLRDIGHAEAPVLEIKAGLITNLISARQPSRARLSATIDQTIALIENGREFPLARHKLLVPPIWRCRCRRFPACRRRGRYRSGRSGRLAVLDVLQEEHRLVAHLERAAGRPGPCERPSFIRSICTGSVSATTSASSLVGDLVLVGLDRGAIGVGHELREAAGRHEGVEVGYLRQDVFHLLHGEREVVVGVERAAVRLGPAVLRRSARRRATRRDCLPASVSRMPCMRSLWLAAAAPPDWMQIVPPFGLICHARSWRG